MEVIWTPRRSTLVVFLMKKKLFTTVLIQENKLLKMYILISVHNSYFFINHMYTYIYTIFNQWTLLRSLPDLLKVFLTLIFRNIKVVTMVEMSCVIYLSLYSLTHRHRHLTVIPSAVLYLQNSLGKGECLYTILYCTSC